MQISSMGGSSLDEQIILNENTPKIYSFLCKSTENRRTKFGGHCWLEERS
jgi:hypothetical protein